MRLPPLVDTFFAVLVTARGQDTNLNVFPTDNTFGCRFVLIFSPEML
jgi:hypothetical protein